MYVIFRFQVIFFNTFFSTLLFDWSIFGKWSLFAFIQLTWTRNSWSISPFSLFVLKVCKDLKIVSFAWCCIIMENWNETIDRLASVQQHSRYYWTKQKSKTFTFAYKSSFNDGIILLPSSLLYLWRKCELMVEQRQLTL